MRERMNNILPEPELPEGAVVQHARWVNADGQPIDRASRFYASPLASEALWNPAYWSWFIAKESNYGATGIISGNMTLCWSDELGHGDLVQAAGGGPLNGSWDTRYMGRTVRFTAYVAHRSGGKTYPYVLVMAPHPLLPQPRDLCRRFAGVLTDPSSRLEFISHSDTGPDFERDERTEYEGFLANYPLEP